MEGAFLQLLIFTYIPIPFKMFFSVSGKKDPVIFIAKTSTASKCAGMQLHTGCTGSLDTRQVLIPAVEEYQT